MNDYLYYCLETYAMRHVQTQLDLYRSKRERIEAEIWNRYADCLAGNITYGGSISKNTQINSSYDVDIIVPFKYDSFTLKDMYWEIAHFLVNEFSDWHLRDAREQRVSVGLRFAKLFGPNVSIDVVPGREASRNNYSRHKELRLWDSVSERYITTNVKAQIDRIKESPENARQIIRLLKIWKTNSEFSIKSFLLELLVTEALLEASYEDLSEDLLRTVDFIQANIESIDLIDPGNRHNIVSDLMTKGQKRKLGIEMRRIYRAVRDEDVGRLAEYFPINRRFS